MGMGRKGRRAGGFGGRRLCIQEGGFYLLGLRMRGVQYRFAADEVS